MLTSKVAKRYAQGLLDFTQEAGSTDQVFAEMKDVLKIMGNSRDLNRFFETPFIDAKKKEAVAVEIFKSFSPVSQNIIRLVIKHGRETQLKNIAQEFINKVEDRRGVQRVTVISATPLAENVVKEILSSTNLLDMQKSYDLNTVISPGILGGYVLRVGDQQVDASVRTKLNGLRKNFQLN